MNSATFQMTETQLRAKARTEMESAFVHGFVVPEGTAIRSNGPPAEAQQFTYLTGLDQAGLESRWVTDPNYTTCGDFVNHFCAHLGLDWIKLLSTDDPQGYCENKGKGLAWISNNGARSPKYGDVFKERIPPNQHVGVSLDFDGGKWWTAEGGQNGKKAKYDSVMRKSSRTLSNGVQGWVDLELWAACTTPQSGIVPQWLSGFWNVSWRGQTYYYYFDQHRQVRYVQFLQMAKTLPFPGSGSSSGRFAVNNDNAVIIRWDQGGDAGAIERFRRMVGSSPISMRLKVNDENEESTPAVKMDPTDIPGLSVFLGY